MDAIRQTVRRRMPPKAAIKLLRTGKYTYIF